MVYVRVGIYLYTMITFGSFDIDNLPADLLQGPAAYSTTA